MEDGFDIVPSLFTKTACDELSEAFRNSQLGKSGRSPNLRNLLHELPLVAAAARRENLVSEVGLAAAGNAFPVRAILFDKTPTANWSLGWHQDLAIAVRERFDVDGFKGWSIKEGVLHVHPPVRILEQMIAARIHLDDCLEENGALMVLPGSHLAGKLDQKEINRWRDSVKPVICTAQRGDVLLMRPLLLHASRPAVNPSRRRILHIEYAVCDLPGGLQWHEGRNP